MRLDALMDELAGALEASWPEGEESVHSKKNSLRRPDGPPGAACRFVVGD